MRRSQFTLKTLLCLMAAWLIAAWMLKQGGFGWGNFLVFAYVALLLAVARWATRH